MTDQDRAPSFPEFKLVPHPAPTAPGDRAAIMASPSFGRVFSDHMATAQWGQDSGWHNLFLRRREPLCIDPAAAVFHYAQQVFEGLKAYRTVDRRVVLFRPDLNALRFAKSSTRLAIPPVPEPLFLAAIEALVRADIDWVPDDEGSLYIRPFIFASEANLSVKPAAEYIFCTIASPVGSYFTGDTKALKIWLSEHYTRAASGGTGAAKCGGNYSGSLITQAQAAEHGCDQVLFLDAREHRWIEELGGMNFFCVLEGKCLVTPPLNDTILPGVTRASILTIAEELGFLTEERLYSMEDLRADAQSGLLTEAFACGTAAVVTGIGEIVGRDCSIRICDEGEGPVTKRLRQRLLDIQRGRIADRHNWLRIII